MESSKEIRYNAYAPTQLFIETALRDYEMIELKLAVAHSEGAAAKGSVLQGGALQDEVLMPGLHAVSFTYAGYALRFVYLNDEFDLSILGLAAGHAALCVHDDDLAWLTSNGLALRVDEFETRSSVPGWHIGNMPANHAETIAREIEKFLSRI